MAEYIEREAVISAITTDGFEHFSGCLSSSEVTLLEILRDSICEIPTADVAEVKHGEWVDNGDRDRNGVPKPFAIFCSVCESSAGTSWMKYCPNCGAKMDGKAGQKMINKLVPLKDCPIGLFVHEETLCVKTEYGNDAIIVSSGEYFWGGAKTAEEIGEILVLPLPNSVVDSLERLFSYAYEIRRPFKGRCRK